MTGIFVQDDQQDMLVVGGVSLAEAIRDPSKVPPEVERAFELAYPNLTAHGETFAVAASRMSAADLPGLVSGVKGKLFELELVDHLNHGGLPDGQHAELAASANQAGWDIRVTDEHGHVVDLIQAKATESASYVQAALEKYPDIHVTTTTEVQAQLTALGVSEDMHDSGISEHVLEAKVMAAAQGGHGLDAGDLVPSTVALAAIALSAFTGSGDLRKKSARPASEQPRQAQPALPVRRCWWPRRHGGWV